MGFGGEKRKEKKRNKYNIVESNTRFACAVDSVL